VRFTPIAAASLIPATIAGIALTITPFAIGTPAVAAASHPARAAVHSAPAHHAAAPAARPAPSQPAEAAAAQAVPAPAAPAPAAPQQPAAPQMSAAEASFEKCVAWRESGDNPTASSAGMFGILPSIWAQLGYSGTAEQASVAQQTVAFHQLYLKYGTHPWAPYDGC
jgi:hypothetical protein